MITFFNRREVRVTRDLNELYIIRNKLTENGIKYCIITNSVTNPGRHHGVPNINANYAYQYRVYVHRRDYQKAKGVLFY